jgi:hypothetical protein
MIFVFAGIGLIVLGALVLAGLAALAVAFPFLLPLLSTPWRFALRGAQCRRITNYFREAQ